MRIAVTGANGFVGARTCGVLRADGHEVVAVVRRGATAPGGATVAEAPVLDEALLRAGFRGCDAVVHLAARVHVMRESATDPLAAFRKVNVEGTRGAYRAACAVGARRFVFLSSVKVHGEGRAEPYVESDEPSPADPYGVSKLEAERMLASARAAGGSADVVVLRPPLVYGAGVGGNFRRLIRLAELAQRWPMPLGGIANRRSLVSVGNLADVIRFMVRSEAASGATVLVSDGTDLSTSELICRLARALGRDARLLPCPSGALRALTSLVGRGAEADRLVGSLTVRTDALRALGWTPPQSVDAALDETARWWRDRSAA